MFKIRPVLDCIKNLLFEGDAANCPTGTGYNATGGKCYFVSPTNTYNWFQAQEQCVLKGIVKHYIFLLFILKRSSVVFKTIMHYSESIGGSRGACPVHAPLWDPILSFSHTFSPKSAHIRGPRPPNGCTLPLREILDPPLESIGRLHQECCPVLVCL